MSTFGWVYLWFFLAPVVCAPFLFKRAGIPTWQAFVPVLNLLALLKLARQSGLRLILFLVPLVQFFAFFSFCRALARAFGKGWGFSAGLAFVAPVFFPMLAFGPATYTLPEEPAEPRADEGAAPVATAAAGNGFGFFAKLLVALPFGALIVWLQGGQADDFKEQSRNAAVGWCGSRMACQKALNEHFEDCYEQNHSSHRRGRYGRSHELDQQGFHSCIEQHISAAR